MSANELIRELEIYTCTIQNILKYWVIKSSLKTLPSYVSILRRAAGATMQNFLLPFSLFLEFVMIELLN